MREMRQSTWLSTSSVTLQASERRVNAMETEVGCNDRISWSNNYSVLPTCDGGLEKLRGGHRRDRHITLPAQCLTQTSGICQSIGAIPASARVRLMCEKHRHPKNFLTDKGEGCAQATTAWCGCVINIRFF